MIRFDWKATIETSSKYRVSFTALSNQRTPIGVKMGSNAFLHHFKIAQKVRKTTVFQVKYGGFMVAGEGFEPPTSGL